MIRLLLEREHTVAAVVRKGPIDKLSIGGSAVVQAQLSERARKIAARVHQPLDGFLVSPDPRIAIDLVDRNCLGEACPGAKIVQGNA